MTNIYVTSDHHFCSGGVIDHCQRPWPSSREMNMGLVERWNDTVDPGDHVYHLGDFAFAGKSAIRSLLGKLNGSIYLVLGNHDTHGVQFYKNTFEHASRYHELTCSGYHHLKDDYPQMAVVMSHYPMLSWNNRYKGSVHLHGHTHSQDLQDDPEVRRFHVGVDSHPEYRPYLLDDLLESAVHIDPR